MAEGQAVETKGTNPVSGGVINSIVGTALGLATANYNDRRQERLNRKIMDQQKANQKEMGLFNQGLALEMWEKTGYEAQRRQLEKAGLNVGLMYGGAGAPGTTQSPPGQSQSGATPVNPGELGMGIQSALTMAMLKAQIENVQADTKLKTTEATKRAGVDTTKTGAEIENLTQRTENEKINNSLLRYQEQLAQIETRVKENTQLDAIDAIKLANERTIEDIRQERAAANISEETQTEIIKQLNTKSQEQALRIEAQKLGLIKTTAETNQINAQINKLLTEVKNMIQTNMREWDKMSQKDREIAISERVQKAAQQATDFNTSTPEQIKQWTNLIQSVLTLGIGGKSNPIGFQR